MRRIIQPILAAFLLVAIAANVYGAQQSFTLAPGDSLHVTCTTNLTGTIGAQAADLVCATLVPTATMTHTPTATATLPAGAPVGACGESMLAWHAPVVNGCNTGHEHGDAPPAWIAQAGYTVSFVGPFSTSEMENTHKHAGMKGFSTRLKNVDIYYRIHAMSNVLDRAARFHSYEVWARDPSGAVSHWQGWNDTGDPVTDRIPRNVNNNGVRPVILVVDQASWNAGIQCEQWYTSTARWSWSIGWTICGSTTLFYPGENSQQDQSFWQLTGALGGTRRAELSFNPVSDGPRGTFWATQFADVVSGPNDARCSQATTIGGVTYPNVCMRQDVAASLPPVVFPGNADQKTFPTTGVHVPN